MSRKIARRYAFELIFQMPFNSEFDAVDAFNVYPEGNLPKINDTEHMFVMETISGVRDNLDALDKRIAANSKGWNLTRFNKVDLAVLRLAIYEICFADIPVGCTINEAVEIAKLYSGDESARFVNGILRAVVGRKSKVEGFPTAIEQSP